MYGAVENTWPPTMALRENLSRGQMDFVRSLARGKGEGVRIEFHRLSQDERHALNQMPELDELILAIEAENAWRIDHPRESCDHFMSGRPVPELKALRAVTHAAVRRSTRWARRLLASVPPSYKPIHEEGLHYRTALAVAEYLSPVVGLVGAVLFGSVARGEERSDSDVDMLLVGARGMRTDRFYGLVVDRLESVVVHSVERDMQFELRPGKLGIAQAPKVHFMLEQSFPSKWEDVGLDSGSVHVLWRLRNGADLVTRRADANPLATHMFDSGTALLYQRGADVMVYSEDAPSVFSCDCLIKAWADVELLDRSDVCVLEMEAALRTWDKGRRAEGTLTVGRDKRRKAEAAISIGDLVDALADKWIDSLLEMIEGEAE